MTCQRCFGRLRMVKLWDDMLKVDVWSCSCINCGDVIDRVILKNRASQRGGVASCTAVAKASCRS